MEKLKKLWEKIKNFFVKDNYKNTKLGISFLVGLIIGIILF